MDRTTGRFSLPRNKAQNEDDKRRALSSH